MRRVVTADHSGDTYEFNGTVSPEFHDAFLAWLKEQAEGAAPDETEIKKDGSVEAKYAIGDETNILVEQKDGKMAVSMSSDWNVMESPNSNWFEETTLVSSDGSVSVLHNGKEYDLEGLLNLVKQLEAKNSMEESAAKVSP